MRLASLIVILLLMLGGCVGGARSSFVVQDRQTALPMGLVSDERHPIRVYLDDERRIALFRNAFREGSGFREGVPVGPDGVVDFLTVSGGGSNGAFTAGIMKGWTESGTRPDFEVVTGVSTGALAAPFIFLGPDWDDELEQAYVGGAASTLLQTQGLGALVGSGVYKGEPLRALVEQYVDEALLQAVAAEFAKGRVLLVATTDLDSQRGVIWDLGAIASAGTPEALELFRSVLVASASIPGAFPPVLIASNSGDLAFEEMHVDGGVSTPILAIPEALWAYREPSQMLKSARFHVIVNGRMGPSFAVTKDSLGGVLSRSIETLLRSSLLTTLEGNRAFAVRNDVFFRYAALPDDSTSSPLNFSPESMRGVFELGRTGALSGEIWR